LKWWQRGVVYEIAAISFPDSDGDGNGDLPGLIKRIDYLDWLGIEAVWLTPIFPSPFLDLGKASLLPPRCCGRTKESSSS
jgi:alpha-glucosidase